MIGNLTIKILKGNYGGSSVMIKNSTLPAEARVETIPTVLLSDIYAKLIETHPEMEQINVVMKMDIENYECKVLLGSEEIFKNPKLFIAMVFMEWAFQVRSEHCPENMMKAVVDMFTSNGYHPFTEGKKMIKASKFLQWKNQNLIWIHNSVQKT